MSRMLTFVAVMAGIVLLFNITGLVSGTPNSALMNFVLEPQSFQSSTLFVKVVLAMQAAAGIGAIFVGFRTQSLTLVASTTFTIFLLNILVDFIVVYSVLAAEVPWLALVIFGPLMIMYVVTAFDFWRSVS